MKILILTTLALVIAHTTFAQKERKFVREGNGYYTNGLKDTAKLDTISFGKAEVAYRRALQIKPDDFHWQFNLANSLYKQAKPDQSATEFEKLADKITVPVEKSMVYHNLGNSLLAQKKFDPSIDAYKKALRITPNDPETKYNLAYAMKMKKKDEEQKKKDQDKNKDQNKDNKDQKKDQNKENKDQNKDQNQQNQNQQPQPQNKITKQSAEQMLQALENDEKQTQEKVKKAQAQQQKSKVDKNW